MSESANDSALSRRGAGASSARALLFTVLGEFVLTGSGTAWTSSLIEVLGRLEVEEKATRQALMRTAADGWLVPERIGRRTKWHLSDSAERLLTDGAHRIYSFTGPAEDWDGRWLLVSARIPESDRSTRHLLRSRLAWAGFGSLAPGLWISTHPERQDEVAGILAQAGCASVSNVFIATRAGVGEAKEMVAAAWDLAAVEAEYEAFLAEFDRQTSGPALAEQVSLVHAWRRFPAVDPELPRELLPTRWSGVEAAGLFRRRHQELAGPARSEWDELEGRG